MQQLCILTRRTEIEKKLESWLKLSGKKNEKENKHSMKKKFIMVIPVLFLVAQIDKESQMKRQTKNNFS